MSEELHAVVKEFMDRYLELKVIPLVENQGLGKALNEGLKHCSYDIVARMDTDDVAKQTVLKSSWRYFRNIRKWM